MYMPAKGMCTFYPSFHLNVSIFTLVVRLVQKYVCALVVHQFYVHFFPLVNYFITNSMPTFSTSELFIFLHVLGLLVYFD